MDRGLIDHVSIVAVLLIMQGALELLFAVLGFAVLAMAYLGPEKEMAGLRGVGILLGLVCVPAVAVGILRIVAGIFSLRFRYRGLGMAAAGLGLLAMVTGYCAPSAIALAIYGLIVYLNESVATAFMMAKSGRTPDEIRAAFLPRI